MIHMNRFKEHFRYIALVLAVICVSVLSTADTGFGLAVNANAEPTGCRDIIKDGFTGVLTDAKAASGSAASGSSVSVKPLKSLYKDTPATTVIDVKNRTKKEKKTMFYVKKIDDDTWKSMKGKSYHKGCPVKRRELRRVRILYVGFDKKTHIGELITNKKIAAVCRDIFKKLYFKNYELKRVQPIDAYDGDDEASMEANNTSCFNHRVVAGSSTLSKHAYGMALDINPRHNPYVIKSTGYVSPKNGKKFANRSKKFKHKITHKDLVYKLFHKEGFFWGGDWIYTKDYQHFQKS